MVALTLYRGLQLSSLYLRQGESLPHVIGEGKRERSGGPRTVSVIGISGSIKHRICRGDGKVPRWDMPTVGSSIDTCVTTILSTFPNLCPRQYEGSYGRRVSKGPEGVVALTRYRGLQCSSFYLRQGESLPHVIGEGKRE